MDTVLGVWTEYRRRRASAYSSSPRDPRRRTGASDHEGAALRLATPASPFALEPTFVVVEIACTEGSASHTAWVLAEIVEGSERGNGTVEVEFYAMEAQEVEGRTVFSRNGISERSVPATRYRPVTPGFVKHLDDYGQRVSIAKDTSLKDVFTAATTSRTRSAVTPPRRPSSWRRLSMDSPASGMHLRPQPPLYTERMARAR